MSQLHDELYPEVCPYEIGRPPMRMRWEDLTMLHWRYPVDEVQRLLPDRLRVESFDGSAWVGLIPFQMEVDVPGLPTWSRVLHFPETNVRTYVQDKYGRPSVWFFSLEASSLPAVVTARLGYRVPYVWADMSIDRLQSSDGPRFVYRSRRRWPGPRGVSSLVEMTVGDRFEPGEAGELDHFLTARWALSATLGPLTVRAQMHHEPWPLHHAIVDRWDNELVAATGLSAPTGPPVTHFSPGVGVRCGWPTLV